MVLAPAVAFAMFSIASDSPYQLSYGKRRLQLGDLQSRLICLAGDFAFMVDRDDGCSARKFVACPLLIVVSYSFASNG